MQSMTPIVTWVAPAKIGEAMEPYQYFIAPIMDDRVQVTRSVAA